MLRIEDNHGTVIEKFDEVNSGRVTERNTALNISSILSDNVARTPLFGANSPLSFKDRDVAAKTGTTNNKKDVWVLGYTPNLAVGAWAGNNNNKEMKELSGLIITPLWRAFMDVALKDLPNETFTEPTMSTTDKPILKGIWLDTSADDTTGIHSILYYVDKNDPTGPPPSNPESDPQYQYWEYGVQNWIKTLLNPEPGTH
jgi:penicillin-binding protein 1A